MHKTNWKGKFFTQICLKREVQLNSQNNGYFKSIKQSPEEYLQIITIDFYYIFESLKNSALYRIATAKGLLVEVYTKLFTLIL